MSVDINKQPVADAADQFSRDAKRQWSKLGDEQLKALHGDSAKLIEAIKGSYGLSRDEAVKQVESWKKNAAAQNQAGKPDMAASKGAGNGNGNGSRMASDKKSLDADRDTRPI